MSKQLLIALLLIGGIVQLLALVPIFFPYSWMAAIHDRMDIGALPELPIISYLTRSLAMLYALLGALCLFIALDVERYLPLVRFLAILKLIVGAGLLLLDLVAGMPWYWTITEGPSLILYSVVLWWLATQMLARSKSADSLQ
jgi:hypothetical protein